MFLRAPCKSIRYVSDGSSVGHLMLLCIVILFAAFSRYIRIVTTCLHQRKKIVKEKSFIISKNWKIYVIRKYFTEL